MNKKTNEELSALIEKATAGDKDALETVILNVQDLIFNLSLRMLGTFADAEDATQDIILKIITHLSAFRKESSFSTWVFSIAANHLKSYKKHMFAHYPLSFEYYGDDIENGQVQDVPDLTQNVERAILEEELKMSCTNVMLQCLDTESRCIFILGTMFKLDSRIAGEVLGLTPESYRQRLSRIRKKMGDFLEAYCGEYGSGRCRCRNRINYAIQNRRLNPKSLDYTSAASIPEDTRVNFKDAMEDIDNTSLKFCFCKTYESPERTRQFLIDFLDSASLSIVKNS
ncbi:RNA polymerase sigma factor [Ruminococcus sp. OA3]|uniref:RNA polymerase sigma factor n=1 Tax=Ruminococcus sp. OA3 TaxID=2914164 RepID=UPI001F06F1F0|nr:RNA polymerase sigma factor [Ruminococcus sp. OA3]MCH1983033.1 RNA polymerase sigma factor [Ruminococcus sp. OA3]